MNNIIIYESAKKAMTSNMSVSELIQELKREKEPEFYCFNQEEIERFVEIIVGHCSESVRQVLRDDSFTLTYEDADKIQQNMKQVFGIKKWSII